MFTLSGRTSPYPPRTAPRPRHLSPAARTTLIISGRNSRLADASVPSNRAPGTGTMSPTATSFSLVSQTGSRGRRLSSRRHAARGRTRSEPSRHLIHHSSGSERERNHCGAGAPRIMPEWPQRSGGGSLLGIRLLVSSQFHPGGKDYFVLVHCADTARRTRSVRGKSASRGTMAGGMARAPTGSIGSTGTLPPSAERRVEERPG
jgi:hypothetical protein